MKKQRVAMTVSVPPDLAEQFEKLAQEEEKSKSQLFRDIFRGYQQRCLEREFYDLQHDGVSLAREQGILTEADVEKWVFEDR